MVPPGDSNTRHAVEETLRGHPSHGDAKRFQGALQCRLGPTNLVSVSNSLPPMRHLSALALQSDYSGQVGARVGIVGLDAQGLLEVFDRLDRLTLGKERLA